VAISLHTSGSWAFDAAGSVTVTLPTHSTGDMLIVRVAVKSLAIATLSMSTATSGWTKLGEFHDGTVNSNIGVGSVAVAVFYKEAASAAESDPTIDFSEANSIAGVVALSYQKDAGETWETPVGDGGPDTTADTSKSMTIQSHVSVTAGDMVDFFMGIRDNTTMTVPTITQTGVTFDTVSEQPATAGDTSDGHDGAYDGGYRLATSGTSSAAAVITGTLSTSETGSGWMTRLRVSAGGAIQRTLTEAVTTADAFTRTGTFLRSTAETLTTSDSWSRVLAAVRSWTETATTSDAWVAAKSTARSWTETVTTADAWIRTGTFVRDMTEAIVSADTWSRVATLVRSLGEAVTTSDSWSRILSGLRSWTEAVTSSDAWVAIKQGAGVIERGWSEGVATSDVWTGVVRLVGGIRPLIASVIHPKPRDR